MLSYTNMYAHSCHKKCPIFLLFQRQTSDSFCGREHTYHRGGVKMYQIHLIVRTQMPQLHNMWLVANVASDTRIQKCFILNFENLNLCPVFSKFL
jgi:hypothetical protein